MILDQSPHAEESYESQEHPPDNKVTRGTASTKNTAAGAPEVAEETTRGYSATEFERQADISGQIAKISISHDGEYATAVCLAVEEPSGRDVGGEAAARDLD